MAAGTACSTYGPAPSLSTYAVCQVLGTLITEWDAGAAACRRLFGSQAAALHAAAQLAALANAHGFEGWLVNIENDLPRACVPHVLTFLGCGLAKHSQPN